jgi:hypothetical protein
MLCLHRTFPGGIPDTAANGLVYCDHTNNPSKQAKHALSQEWTLSKFPTDRIVAANRLSFEEYQALCGAAGTAACESENEAWVNAVRDHLDASLSAVMAEQREWRDGACGLGVPGDEAFEILQHAAWARDKIDSFHGRADLLRQAFDIIFSPQRQHDAQETPLSGVTLCIVGVSGAGKTAFMAKLAEAVTEHQQQITDDAEEEVRGRPVLIRFCGTSPGSASGLALVRSLCRQIHAVLGIAHPTGNQAITTMGYDAVVSHFHGLLRDHALVVFIDSLDQLSNADLARSELSFLKGLRPHKHTRVVVSCLPDQRNDGKMAS